MSDKDWLYLGDGVYASYDGFGIWLHTGSHDNPTNKICLEPSIMNSLITFYNIQVNTKGGTLNGPATS